MQRLTALVSGKVQQVGYRSRVLSAARALDITGYVMNLPDGTVKINAEGDEVDLDRFPRAALMAFIRSQARARRTPGWTAGHCGRLSDRFDSRHKGWILRCELQARHDNRRLSRLGGRPEGSYGEV